jgi:hypothetical protein
MAAPKPSTIVVDVGGLAADALTVDALARLPLAARRVGREVRLRHAAHDLCELLAFTGLDGVLRVEARGQAEEGEQRLGVEKERELGDSIP